MDVTARVGSISLKTLLLRVLLLSVIPLAGCMLDGDDQPAGDTSMVPQAATSGPPGTVQRTIIPLSYWWSYYDTGDQGTAWRYPADWEDSEHGPGPFGYGESYLTTIIRSGSDPSHRPTTAYFRREFDIDPTKVKALFLRIMYDDGFVFYINGKEGGRAHMPGGPVSFSTLALGHEANNQYQVFDISAQIPRLTTFNSFAVEVHQVSPSSSDLVFSAELIAWMDEPIDTTTRSDIPRKSYWRLWDRSPGPATTWKTPGHDDSTWSAAPAPMGYGESYLASTLTSGSITTYFRKKFTIDGPIHGLRGEVMYDDGFVVYLNGQEIGRRAMPPGAVTPSTLSTGHEAGQRYESFDWSAAVPLLVQGENTIAVEVHQNSSTSSDLVFDLALEVRGPWYRVPAGADLHASAIWFTDADHGWAVGSTKLWQTADGGVTWNERHLDNSAGLFGIQFVDALHGWIVGGEGTIFATRDGGLSWERQSAGVDRHLGDLSFVSPTTGWIVATDEVPEGGDSLPAMWKTVDGGATWSPLGTDVHRAFFSAISFADASHGWVAAATFDDLYEHGIFGTSDGGATWTRQWSGGVAGLTDVEAIDPTTSWVSSWSNPHSYRGELKLVTRDGTSWSSAPPSGNGGGLQGIEFLDGNRGWACGNGGSIIATTDGGASWYVQRAIRLDEQGYSTDDSHLGDIHFVDGAHGWAIGSGPVLLRTTTGGL